MSLKRPKIHYLKLLSDSYVAAGQSIYLLLYCRYKYIFSSKALCVCFPAWQVLYGLATLLLSSSNRLWPEPTWPGLLQ